MERIVSVEQEGLKARMYALYGGDYILIETHSGYDFLFEEPSHALVFLQSLRADLDYQGDIELWPLRKPLLQAFKKYLRHHYLDALSAKDWEIHCPRCGYYSGDYGSITDEVCIVCKRCQHAFKA